MLGKLFIWKRNKAFTCLFRIEYMYKENSTRVAIFVHHNHLAAWRVEEIFTSYDLKYFLKIFSKEESLELDQQLNLSK